MRSQGCSEPRDLLTRRAEFVEWRVASRPAQLVAETAPNGTIHW